MHESVTCEPSLFWIQARHVNIPMLWLSGGKCWAGLS